MGWGDFSCFGNEHPKTPHIDRLAKEGLRFDQFYVNSPICSPSRVAISTGQYPQKWKITSYLSNRDHNKKRGMAQWLDPKAPMLARSLQKNGYATGHFGKWHMGGQRNVADAPPISDYGFDQSLTNFEGMGPKLLPLTLKPGQDPKRPGRIWGHAEILGKGARWMQRSKITEGFVDAAIPFIKKAKQENKPFYINLWPDDVHTPFWPPVEQWKDGSKRQLFLSVLEETILILPTIRLSLHAPITVRKKEPELPGHSVDIRPIFMKGESDPPSSPGHPNSCQTKPREQSIKNPSSVPSILFQPCLRLQEQKHPRM
jgi:uncharacterized sulfatase